MEEQKTKKRRSGVSIKRDTKRGSLSVELPAVPCFPWVTADTEPPHNVVLLVLCEEGFVLGEFDGHNYFDSTGTKITRMYGEVLMWCIVLNPDGECVVTE